MSSSSSAKVILLKLVQIMEAEFLFFFPPSFPPSWCRQLSLPTPIFGSSAQIPPVSEPVPPRHEQPPALGAGAGAADEGTGANYQ